MIVPRQPSPKVCPVCSKFISTRNISRHIREVHETPKSPKSESSLDEAKRINLLPEKYRPVTKTTPSGAAWFSPPPISRFLSKVDKLGPIWNGTRCWEWTAFRNEDGYGQFSDKIPCCAHVFSYKLFRGEIETGKQIDHQCRNRGCVNPYHLELVTSRENTLRGYGPSALAARKTHCTNGHEFTEENTRIEKQRNGVRRRCLACRREWPKRNQKLQIER